ncbi:MAG: hypothetical protein R3F30_04635 [Planctomycetota bacterium]
MLRSVTHGVNAHETAAYIVQTGLRQPDRPAGAAAAFKGRDAGYKRG